MHTCNGKNRPICSTVYHTPTPYLSELCSTQTTTTLFTEGTQTTNERMPRTITTLSVHPDRAEKLREIRDERNLPNLDAALGEVLRERGE